MSDAFSTVDAEAAELARIASRPRKVHVRPASEPALVDVKNLQVAFGPDNTPVVRGISFSVHRGECLAIIGESGSGKSVTSRSLVGLAGEGAGVTASYASFAGKDLLKLDARSWRSLRGGRIGFVMQDALGSLDPLRTVEDEIDESLKLHTTLNRRDRHDRVLQVLRSVGIRDPEVRGRQHPHELSGGLRQRALIASAIACNPELLIADEPTTALDARVQKQVLDLLFSIRTPQNAMIVVSHDFAVVSHLADTVAVMQAGLIVEHGPIEAVLRAPRHPYTRSLLDAVKAVHTRSRGVFRRAETTAKEAPKSKPVVLDVSRLTKTFPTPTGERRVAVDAVSFSLHAGETIGIVGESGSGKTTTIRMILGLEKADAGHVVVRGKNWSALSGEEKRIERRRMQVVFQDPLGSFDPRYTVRRVVGEAIALDTLTPLESREQRAFELLDLVRLDHSTLDQRPLELSGGQRQRLSIARALALRPEVLVCDEPVSALDVSIQRQILDLLLDLKGRLGVSCLFISHDLGVIQRVSDRVIVMKDGAIVEIGDVASLFANPAHPYTQALLSAIPFPEYLGDAIHI